MARATSPYTEVTGATGEEVWARIGGYGWREAIVEFPGVNRGIVPLVFCGRKKITHGKREMCDLRPRDPAKRGKDKPSAALAREIADAGRTADRKDSEVEIA